MTDAVALGVGPGFGQGFAVGPDSDPMDDDPRIARFHAIADELAELPGKAKRLSEERAAIVAELRAEGAGSMGELARRLGISRPRLYQMLGPIGEDGDLRKRPRSAPAPPGDPQGPERGSPAPPGTPDTPTPP